MTEQEIGSMEDMIVPPEIGWYKGTPVGPHKAADIEQRNVGDARIALHVASAIHQGLGGNGWAYSNYGNNEWVDCKDELFRAAYAAINAYRDATGDDGK